MVKTFSNSKDGNKNIQPNFKIREFACKDGSDKILLETDIPLYLQLARNGLDADSCKVVSGYRTESHNAKVGGSKTSKHLTGSAADVRFMRNGVILPSEYSACMFEILGMPGIERIDSTNTHCDLRISAKWWTVKNGSRYIAIPTNSWFSFCKLDLKKIGAVNPFFVPMKTVAIGTKGFDARWVQFELVRTGYMPLLNANGICSIDGGFGEMSVATLKKFQADHGLTVDGRCGSATKKMLLSVPSF